MLKALDYGYIRTKIWLSNLKDDFTSDERGVSGIVATVILVLLAVLLAAIFWEKVRDFVKETLWNQVTSNAVFDK